jgi:hypothetical protein
MPGSVEVAGHPYDDTPKGKSHLSRDLNGEMVVIQMDDSDSRILPNGESLETAAFDGS